MSNEAISNLQTQNSSRLRNQIFVLLFALLMVTQSIGCAKTNTRLGFGEAIIIGYRDKVWAKRAYNLRYGNCDRPYEEHFQSGFCAGYTTMANGGDGYVPALPPQEYRGFEFQSADGAQCVNSWFEGFPEGVAAAKKEKVGTYHDVLISRMISTAIKQDNAETKLPSDAPVDSSNQATGVPIERPLQATPASNQNSTPSIGRSTGIPQAQIYSQHQVAPATFTSSSDNPLPMAMSEQPWNTTQN